MGSFFGQFSTVKSGTTLVFADKYSFVFQSNDLFSSMGKQYFQVRYDFRVVIYNRRGFIRLATGRACIMLTKQVKLCSSKIFSNYLVEVAEGGAESKKKIISCQKVL